jgi:LDH2 family malate/lactate/ureidoglycolate dehydrogenase
MALEYDSILISPQGHRNICQAVFRRIGMSEPCADAVSDSLLFADLRGTNSHGISRIKQYTDNARSGYFDIKGEPEIIGDRGGTLHINGHNGYGAHVSTFAMQKAIERARTTGIAFCVVNQSTHFGAAAYFAMMALPYDCIGLALSNGVPTVAHHGANRAQTGTNPLAIAFPAQRHRPYVLDMATSVAAGGNIINCAREGKPIPSGWACDSQGQPTTDAKQALQGYCLPLGGYKGSWAAVRPGATS